VNFLYDDIVHLLQNTTDSCINSATDRRGGYVLESMFTKFSEITQCNGHYAVQGHSKSPILVPIESPYTLVRGECLTLTLSLGVIPCQYRHKWYIAKNYISWSTFLTPKVSRYLQPLLRNPPRKLPNCGEIKQPLGLLRRSRSFKVTDFGTNRKLICDFLLVINTNLAP